MVVRRGMNCVIMKRDIKDAFRNISVAPHHQWLLVFTWRNKYYKETCLLLGLSTAPFIFNLFGKGLYWILVSHLRWTLVHYLDDFVAVFSATQAIDQRLRQESRTYNWVTDLLEIPRNELKNGQGTWITVFEIEIDTMSFTARLPTEKLDKAVKATARVFTEQSVSLLDMQSFVGFLSFCSQAVCLGRVFMRRLWDFINQFPQTATKLTRRRIPNWVKEAWNGGTSCSPPITEHYSLTPRKD